MSLYKSIIALLILSVCTRALPQSSAITEDDIGTVTDSGPIPDLPTSEVEPDEVSLRKTDKVPTMPDGTIPVIIKAAPGQSIDRVTEVLDRATTHGNVDKVMDTDAFTGATGSFTNGELNKISSQLGNGAQVERDQIVSIARTSVQLNTPSWALVRLSSKGDQEQNVYMYPQSAGRGVPIYVVDTGVYAEHPDFIRGNVRRELNLVEDEPEITDLNGHGTHVAGLICSKTYGVAKQAKVFAIKALNKDGSGMLSSILKSIDYVVQKNAASHRGVKAIINMSLAGPPSTILDEAINRAADTGIAIIAAAGNFNIDACKVSPANSRGTFAVGSVDENVNKAWFTNFGQCVNAFAPGINVISTYIATDGADPAPSRVLSGTSMSAPLMSGAAALYATERNYANVPAMYEDLRKCTLPVLQGFDETTPNRLGSIVALLDNTVKKTGAEGLLEILKKLFDHKFQDAIEKMAKNPSVKNFKLKDLSNGKKGLQSNNGKDNGNNFAKKLAKSLAKAFGK